MTYPTVHPSSFGISEFHRFIIAGSSMFPNLKNGQEVVFFGRPENVTRGSIVAFRNPATGKVSVKGVVGLAGASSRSG